MHISYQSFRLIGECEQEQETAALRVASLLWAKEVTIHSAL